LLGEGLILAGPAQPSLGYQAILEKRHVIEQLVRGSAALAARTGDFGFDPRGRS